MKHIQFKDKIDYQNALLELCEPLQKYYSEGRAYLNVGVTTAHYDKKTVGIEGFSRPLWGLVPLWAGGEKTNFLEAYREGFKNGSNPKGDEYWGELAEGHQAFVEMAAMGLGLLLAPDKVWEPLSAIEKENLTHWLLQINAYEFSRNNWQFFKVIVNIGLKKVGARYSQEAMEESLEIIEECYLGDGWYSDGKSNQRDYYIPFAMHFYGLIYAKTMYDTDTKRCKQFKERAELFAKDFIYWFTESGEALPYGRSQTYRFAQCAFFSALAFADVEALPWGVVKGIVNRHLREWFQKPILDKEGILTIGYAYPNLVMSEGYNSPSSPYWALKSFLVLALEDIHPFWLAEEEALPALDKLKVLKHAKMIMQRPEEDHIIALTSGQYAKFKPVNVAERYSKFAYSSYFGFNVAKSYYLLDQAAPDNMLVFKRDEMHFVRRECEKVEIREESIYSKWSPLSGITVETVIEPYKAGHTRTHTIWADFDVEALECGFSVPDDTYPLMNKLCGKGFATVDNRQGYSHIELMQGEADGDVIICEANTNLVHPRTAMPYVSMKIKKGITVIKTYVIGLKNKPE